MASLATSREQIYQIARDTKWMIAVSVFLSVILFLPDQIRELYRIVVADVTLVNIDFASLWNFTFRDWGDLAKVAIIVAKLVVPVFLLSLALWAGLNQVMAESLRRIADPTPVTQTVARLLPPLFGVLPLVAAALGQVLSIPRLAEVEKSDDPVASAWDNFASELFQTIAPGLIWIGVGTLVLALALLACERYAHPGQDTAARLNELYFGRIRYMAVTVLLIAVLAAAFYFSPVRFPESIGSFGIIALFAVGIVVFTVHVSMLTMRWRFPVMPCVFAFAIIWAVFDTNDNHDVRPLATSKVPAEVPTASEAFRQWYETRPNLADYEEYPVYLVTAQGGGIYAAYQTAIFLARLYDLCPGFGDHVFAISSVSGGSVGAAAFAAALHARAEGAYQTAATPVSAPGPLAAGSNSCPTITEHLLAERPPHRHPDDPPGPLEDSLRRYFKNDFLSPLIGATVFLDFAQGFLPFPVPAFDRARGLELALEQAERAFGNGTPQLTRSYFDHRNPERRVPALLINTSDAGSGRRVVISPFSFGNGKGVAGSAVVSYQDLGRAKDNKRQYPPDIRLSTAASISARFPWVTPAATVPVGDMRFGPQKKLRLVDGGYVDNSGVETALDLVDAIRGAVDDIGRKALEPNTSVANTGIPYRRVKLRMISLSGGDYSVRGSFALGDVLEPVRALLSTRSSRAYVAIDRANKEFVPYELETVSRNGNSSTVTTGDLRISNLTSRYYPLPLGWAMSDRTRKIVERQSGHFWDCEPGLDLKQSQQTLSEADCIQLMIYHVLSRSLNVVAREVAGVKLAESLDKGELPAPRVPYNRLISCYRDKEVKTMIRRQAQALEALLVLWDRNPQWTEDRWLAFILGTIANETANFQLSTEQLSFKSAALIRLRWPEVFPTVADALPFVNDPEKLADKLYANYGGNTQPGDAWRYRKRGVAALLGREDYRKYGELVGVDLLENPEWVINPALGARIAFHAYFGPVMDKLGAHLNASKTDWGGAVGILPRPAKDEEGIAWKSERFLECIAEAKKNGG